MKWVDFFVFTLILLSDFHVPWKPCASRTPRVHLTGSIHKAPDSWSQGGDFKPHTGHGAYLKKKKKERKRGEHLNYQVLMKCFLHLPYKKRYRGNKKNKETAKRWWYKTCFWGNSKISFPRDSVLAKEEGIVFKFPPILFQFHFKAFSPPCGT